MINRSNIDITLEKDVLKMNLEIQSFFKKRILVYMEKISDNAINSFNSSSGNIAYDYLKRVKDLLSKADENIECINSLIDKLNSYSTEFNDSDLDFFVTSYNEIYESCMHIVTKNSLDIQNLLNELLDYIRFDFSSFSRADLINNLSNIFVSKQPKNIISDSNSLDCNDEISVKAESIVDEKNKKNDVQTIENQIFKENDINTTEST